MMDLKICCAAMQQFFHSFDLKLPPKDEILLAFQMEDHIIEIQELLVEHIERKGEPIFEENILIKIGHKYIIQDRYEEAARCFLTNAIQYPESVRSWEGLALAESLQGNLSHALNFYSEALVLDPSNDRIEKIIATLSNQIIQCD